MISPVKAIFLDLSGVLYDGDQVIAGAPEALQSLRAKAKLLRFVTNTATQNARQILARLHRMGFDVAPDELITAPLAAKRYVQEQGLRPLCILHRSLHEDFADIDQSSPNAVLLGDAQEGLSYEALNQAFRLCKSGCPLIGIGLNKYFSSNGELCLDVGMYVRGLEWAADVQATIVGKPSKIFFGQIATDCSVEPAQCLMVGDDVLSDVLGAQAAGWQSCLVRTGKYREGDEEALPVGATLFDDFPAFVASFGKAG